MPFLGSALGYLIAMCSPGWGNLVAFDWNDLPLGREFDGKFLKNVKSPPHTLPLPPPAGFILIGATESKAKHRRFRSEYGRGTHYSSRKEQKVSKVRSVEEKFYFLPPVFDKVSQNSNSSTGNMV